MHTVKEYNPNKKLIKSTTFQSEQDARAYMLELKTAMIRNGTMRKIHAMGYTFNQLVKLTK